MVKPGAQNQFRINSQQRTLDGTAYRIVKVAYEPAELGRQLRELGWDITVTPTADPFYWGAGNRAKTSGRE